MRTQAHFQKSTLYMYMCIHIHICACWPNSHAGKVTVLPSLSPSINISINIYYQQHHYKVRLLMCFDITPQLHQISLNSTTNWQVSITFLFLSFLFLMQLGGENKHHRLPLRTKGCFPTVTPVIISVV